MTRLDQRTQVLKISTGWSKGRVQLGMPPLSPAIINGEKDKDTTLEDLNNCIELFETIKMMCSSDRVPVMLVYRERRPRKQHRHSEKGRSNRITFAKEKRDFLELLGVPGQMITEHGFDYSVKPGSICIETDEKKPNIFERPVSNHFEREFEQENNGMMTDQAHNIYQTSVGEETELLKEENDESNEKKMKMVARTVSQQLIGFRSKHSVSPYPEEKVPETEKPEPIKQTPPKKKKSKKKKKKDKKKKKKEEEEEEEIDLHPELRSVLSCDTCSSDEYVASDEEEEEEELLLTDEADAITFNENTIHKETILPPPTYDEDEEGTFLTFAMEKIGVKDTYRLSCPFIRMSLRG